MCCVPYHPGEAERSLRLLFQEAERRAPSIIFFDEIDGLAPAGCLLIEHKHSTAVESPTSTPHPTSVCASTTQRQANSDLGWNYCFE
jgi:hypothetical protein